MREREREKEKQTADLGMKMIGQKEMVENAGSQLKADQQR